MHECVRAPVTRPTSFVARRNPRLTRFAARAACAAVGATIALPVAVSAHGQAPVGPTLAVLVDGWSFAADVWLPAILAAFVYWQARAIVNRHHPHNPVPRWRLWSWLGGIGAILLALASPIEFYDTTLFSIHMIQHLLLAFVAAPLLVLAAPITLLLRFATPAARRRWILPFLHSRAVDILSRPIVAWILFAGVMWFTHFSPLFDAALDDQGLHRLEHALYLGTALLFWWPVVGADPSPHRLGYPGRILYLALGMPLSSLLGLVIFSAPRPLYPHYELLERAWGPSALEDQALAGGIMWVGGDAAFVAALVVTVAVWIRHEERENQREDARLARAKAGTIAAAAASASAAATPATSAVATGEPIAE